MLLAAAMLCWTRLRRKPRVLLGCCLLAGTACLVAAEIVAGEGLWQEQYLIAGRLVGVQVPWLPQHASCNRTPSHGGKSDTTATYSAKDLLP